MFMLKRAIEGEPIQQPTHPAREFNVLLLGETQAGKSTFIQATRQYADSAKFNYGLFPNRVNADDYEDELNERKKYTLQHGEISDENLRFNLYDTPGLNDTNSMDELHVANIFDKIKEAGRIHLVLIMVGKGPFSPGLRNAIRCYLDIFPQFDGIMAFVHTKIDYKDLHPGQLKFKQYMEEKMKVIHEIMGRNSFTHFWIDCNLESNKPVRKCITHNTIRKILKVAMLNRPISLKATLMCKTPKMRETDSLVKDKYEGMSKAMEDALRFKNTEEGNTLADIYSLNTSIINNESEEKSNDLYIQTNGTDELQLLDEIRHDDTWGLFRDLFNYETEGGSGEKFWKTRFRRKNFQNGVLYAKFYVQKCNKYRQEILRMKIRQCELDQEWLVLTSNRESQDERSRKQREEIEGLVKRNDEYMKLVSIVKEVQMRPEVFRALAEAGAYVGTPSENVHKVVEVYARVLEEQWSLRAACDSDVGVTVDNSMESDDEDDNNQSIEPFP
ncbi:hypothetical protein EDD21DRAFT_440296 [Dissophora ornata]|nr:hypothetical protein EDD21DRAFT_440296 [Dissophora ornata]